MVEPDRLGVVPDRDDMALVACLRDSEPSTFEEASQHLVWRDAMMEEYHSIMKNDACLGDSIETGGEVSCDFQMALQGKACCRWQR